MMAIQKDELKVHSTSRDARIYSAFAVNLRDMRLALQRLATSLVEKKAPPSGPQLDAYASEMIKGKIHWCEAVSISQEKRQLFIRAVDEDGATHLYATSLPPEWPTTKPRSLKDL
jgi:hypothetical protein